MDMNDWIQLLRTDLFAVEALEVRVPYTEEFDALKRFSVSLPDAE